MTRPTNTPGGFRDLGSAVFDRIPEALVLIDAQGVIVQANASAATLLVRSAEGLVGQPLVDLICPTQHNAFARALGGFFSDPCAGPLKPPAEAWLVVQQPGQRWFAGLHISPIEHDQACFGLVKVRDLERLTADERRLGRLARAMARIEQAVMLTDADLRVEWVNDACCRLTGHDPRDLIGRPAVLLQTGPHERERFAPLWAAIHRGQSWTGELTHQRRDGSTYDAEVSIVPLRDLQGRLEQLLVTHRDITSVNEARQRLERQTLELGRRNAELEQFVYLVSHDLKSPLVTIQGFAEVIREDLKHGDDRSVAASCGQIMQASSRMLKSVDDLLELSRIGAGLGPTGPVNLGDLAEELVQMHGGDLAERGFDVRIDPRLPAVEADERWISQALENLISNAIKYAGEDGSPMLTVGVETAGGQVRVYVADDGPGVPLEMQERIFGVFERLDRSKAGTGVGLAIVSRVAQMHGGEVGVISEPGQGAKFWFSLPAERLLMPAFGALPVASDENHPRQVA